MEPLELRTHTRLWQVEKKLYKLYDFTLPVPLSIRMIGVFLVAGIVWGSLMKVIGVPFAPPFGHLLWIAPPAAATWLANKPVAEGKRLLELLASQAKFYLLQSKTYADLNPCTEPARRFVTGTVQYGSPDGAANPTPIPSANTGG